MLCLTLKLSINMHEGTLTYIQYGMGVWIKYNYTSTYYNDAWNICYNVKNNEKTTKKQQKNNQKTKLVMSFSLTTLL